MAAICLLIGLTIGYVFRGSKSPLTPAPTAASSPSPASNPAISGGHMPTLQEMKQKADAQVAVLIEKLKSDPNNTTLLVQIGGIYHSSHQFKEAALYYGKAVQADPKNIANRTRLASSLFRNGDVDGAIDQLNQALKLDPKDANSLFDLGMIRLQGKQDRKGALAAWRQLLKSNPQLSADRKATVQKLITEVQTTPANQHGIEGARSNDGNK
jgi:cytochrome c-type biogenesis protein CcmH/NrfG